MPQVGVRFRAAQRADAPDGLVQDISAKVAASPARQRRAWSRVAFASAVSVGVVGTFASFGGLGYASSGASGTYSAVKQIVREHTLKVAVHRSSAADQYHPASRPAAFTPPKTPTSSGVHAAIKAQGRDASAGAGSDSEPCRCRAQRSRVGCAEPAASDGR